MSGDRETFQESLPPSSPPSSNGAQRSRLATVIGIGASSHSIGALRELLMHVPLGTGFVFIVLSHSDPGPHSTWSDELGTAQGRPVVQVRQDAVVRANHVYIVPPNRYVNLQNGTLTIAQPPLPRETRLPIDYFFRSLAREMNEGSVAILLSGTENDGFLGLEAIKEHGGLTFAQAPSSTDDPSLLGAISSGVVDHVATPDQIALHLVDCAKFASNRHLRIEQRRLHPAEQSTIQKILSCLHEHSGHDFRGYKENTIARRIERRMMVNRIESLDEYVQFLDAHPAEVDALFRELLIGVTSFFRDPEAFEFLEERVLSRLFTSRRDSGQAIRVWVPGCSTGEEAYSIAILLHEYAARSRKRLNFQIFATDIDNMALDRGRSGRYPASIMADIEAERFNRYFTHDKSGHMVVVDWRIRDSVVFAMQSIIKDPPFSKLDLICCRNLMIYFGAELQQRLLPVLHYALNPGGYLFLGNSETLGNSQRLFRTLDHKWKIFQRQELGPDARPSIPFHRVSMALIPTPINPPDRRPSLREATEQLLLAEHTPTAIVVNASGDMLYVHGRTGKYLEQTTGDVSTNIFKVARDGLRMPLTTAIHNVTIQKKPLHVDGIMVRHEHEVYHVRLSVSPIQKPDSVNGLILVTMTELFPPSLRNVDGEAEGRTDSDSHLEELERELRSTRQYLQTTIGQLETTNEELTSSNEDLQSSNEELQSANEELQTSKEELQSVNEELSTLNAELQHKINDLVTATNDIKNLLDNAQVGIIFLDTKLRIRRFTKAATNIVDLIPADYGRPLAQFVHRLQYDRLVEDAQEVLQTQRLKEMEVHAVDDRWYLARILPYRTIDDDVDGVVLTFTDVTQLKESNEKLEFLFNVLPVGVAVLDRERKAFKYNAAYLEINDLSLDELADQTHLARPTFRPDGTSREYEEFAVSRVLAGEPSALNVESGFTRRDGKFGWINASAVACSLRDWSVVSVASDITARMEAEIALQASEQKFSKAFYLAPLMIGIIDEKTRALVDCNERFLEVSGFRREEVIGASAENLGWMPPATGTRLLENLNIHGYMRNEEITCYTKDGAEIHCLYHGFVIEVQGRKQVVSMIQDIGERKRREDTIKATLRQEKETVLRELAHRTKNNMFVIRSMLSLHAMHTQNEEVRRLFADVENKILAMSLVHQKLYQSKNLSRLDLGEYLRELAPALAESHSLTAGRISVEIDAEFISALIDTAIPCGLVVTELVSNAFKHAFPGARQGVVRVSLHRKSPDLVQLTVQDDGIGVGGDFDFRNQSTLGLQIIFMIVEHQLKGTVEFRASSSGLHCQVEFNDAMYSERV